MSICKINNQTIMVPLPYITHARSDVMWTQVRRNKDIIR